MFHSLLAYSTSQCSPPPPPSLAHARQVLVKSMLAVKQSHVPLPHREREEEGEVFKAKVYTNHVTLLHQQLVAIVILSNFFFFNSFNLKLYF